MNTRRAIFAALALAVIPIVASAQDFAKGFSDAVTNHKVTSGADASYAHAQRLPDQRAILKQWAEFVEEA